jgi:hypothetical protein
MLKPLTLNLDCFIARKPWTVVTMSFYYHPAVGVLVDVPASAARRHNIRTRIPDQIERSYPTQAMQQHMALQGSGRCQAVSTQTFARRSTRVSALHA